MAFILKKKVFVTTTTTTLPPTTTTTTTTSTSTTTTTTTAAPTTTTTTTASPTTTTTTAAPTTTTTTATPTTTTTTASPTTTTTTTAAPTQFDAFTYALAETGDNKYLIVGGFTDYNSTSTNRIIKLNTNGTIDGTFVYGTGLVGFGFGVTIAPDSKIYIGGNYSTYNGTGANSIVRLNTNGSIDGGFAYGTGFNERTRQITNTSDSKIIVAGWFSSYNGTAASGIVKLNTDGTIDGTFVYGTGLGGNGYGVIETSDNKYLVIGTFSSYNGTGAQRVVKLNTNGTVDGTFVYGTGFASSSPEGVIETSDNKYLFVGGFPTYNGTAANGIVKVNTDGTIDGGFAYGTGFAGTGFEVIETSDNKYLVGGSFSSYNGTAASRVIKLNTDGTVDGTFVYGTGFNGDIYGIMETFDNKYVFTGNFTSYNGTSANRIIKLNSDGSVDPSFIL